MILVTGFGPYREDINASGELVASFKERTPEGVASIEGPTGVGSDNVSRLLKRNRASYS
jgi:hypothetical protein